ncbi:MAG: hypothetical protein ACEPO2_18900 [Pelagibaca sp.]
MDDDVQLSGDGGYDLSDRTLAKPGPTGCTRDHAWFFNTLARRLTIRRGHFNVGTMFIGNHLTQKDN